jgi:hypothetical protein
MYEEKIKEKTFTEGVEDSLEKIDEDEKVFNPNKLKL